MRRTDSTFWCRFLHRWGQWERAQVAWLSHKIPFTSEYTDSQVYTQRRKCERCGAVDVRIVDPR